MHTNFTPKSRNQTLKKTAVLGDIEVGLRHTTHIPPIQVVRGDTETV